MDRLLHYMPGLTYKQIDLFSALGPIYTDWNQKINVVSRKDIHLLYLRHILHSLSISKIVQFSEGSKILDLGTGGGFPGIPLAILFPESDFTLIDSTAKKINVVNAVVNALKLGNVKALHGRAENHRSKYDFVVSRAVTSLVNLYSWCKPMINPISKNSLKNGLIALKGGQLESELQLPFRKHIRIYPISNYYSEEYYKEKYILYLPLD